MRNYFHCRFAILLLIFLHSSFMLSAQFSGGGDGSVGNPFQISNRADLEALTGYLGSSGEGKHFRLTADIDLAGADWTPIGLAEPDAFRGSLHGGGHHISNISVDGDVSNLAYIGLFGVLGFGAQVDSVHIVSGEIKGGSNDVMAGALAGLATNSGNQNYGITIFGCSNSAQVNTDGKTMATTGGLIGQISSLQDISLISLTACVNTGTVIGGGMSTGGLVGKCAGTRIAVSDSYSQALVRATNETGPVYAGGLIGAIAQNGSNADFRLEKCYATGRVHAAPSPSIRVGGLVGSVEVSGGTVTITQSVAAQDTLTGPAGYTHRIVGDNNGITLSDNYAYSDMQVNGTEAPNSGSTTNEGQNRTSILLRTGSIYNGLSWSIGDVGNERWNIQEGKSYPYLQWQGAPVVINYLYCDTVSFDIQGTADSVLVYRLEATGVVTFLEKIETVSSGKYLLNSTIINPGYNLSFIACYAGKQPSYPVMQEVSKRNITISAGAQTITYGEDSNLNFGAGSGYTITAGALSDGHVLDGELTLKNAAKSNGGYYRAGTYTFGTDDIKVMAAATDMTDDYNITFSSATVTINKLELSHNITASSKVYDRTTAASYTGGLLSANIKANDGVVIDGGFRLTFKNPNAGNNKAVIPEIEDLWTLAGADGGNYVFTPWDTLQSWARANITVKPLDSDINAIAAPQTYTGSACTTTVVVAFGAATMTENVDYIIDGYDGNINAGAATITIRGKGNYDPASTKDIPFTIAPMSITVAELTAQNKTYDGTTAATLTFDETTFKDKLVAADRAGITVSSPTTGSFAQADVDKNIAVTASGSVILSGGNAANYTLIQQTGLKADIDPKPITSNDISIAPVSPLTYTGGSITPALTIHDGATLLIANSDYTVTYRENVDVGSATATVRGTGNYSNTETTSTCFTIVQKAITVEELAAQSKVFDGTTAATLTFDETTFENKLAAADRTVITVTRPPSGTFAQSDVGNNIAVTAVSVELSGAKALNYDVTQQTGLTANITQKALTAADLTIAPVAAETYTGAAMEPPLVVTEGANTLRPTLDYTVSYANNVDAGTASATVTITGTGNYSGNASTATMFTILRKSIAVEELTAQSKVFDGTAAATLTFDETTFKNKLAAVDIPVITVTAPISGSFVQSNVGVNISVVAATNVTLSGAKAANYEVTQQTGLQADITQKALTAADLTIAPVSSYTYTGMPIVPPVVVAESGNTLTQGYDYTVGYANNVDAGTASATVTITGSNYSGNAAVTTTFLIMPKDINAATIMPVPNQKYTGAAITPPLTITDGATLTLNTDYIVEYNNNVDVGMATVTVTGINNYTATQQISFTIIRKSITDADITIMPIPAQTYTGSNLTPPVTVLDGAATLTELTDYTVAYANNLNAGTATVTITGTGNYDGSSNVDFEIRKADQTINFPNIQPLRLIDGSYVLPATATSGLQVTYTSSNPTIADIGNDGVTMRLRQLGTATITASQQGNANYNPATPVQRQVTIEESGIVGVLRVTVIGAEWDAVNNRYLMRCGVNSVTVIVEPEDYTARVYYNNILGSTFVVEMPVGVHAITYKVASGANEREYTLEIAKPFKFDDVVKMRWNNTLTVINNPANNGGFHFTKFAWYGDGRQFTTEQSFSVGNTGQTIDPTINYHVVLAAEEYSGTLNTCPSTIVLRQNALDMTMVAYPNPAQSNGFVFVEISIEEELLDHAEIEIFNLVGMSMGKVRVAGRITPVNMSALPTGMYLLNLRGKNNLNKIVKILVQ